MPRSNYINESIILLTSAYVYNMLFHFSICSQVWTSANENSLTCSTLLNVIELFQCLYIYLYVHIYIVSKYRRAYKSLLNNLRKICKIENMLKKWMWMSEKWMKITTKTIMSGMLTKGKFTWKATACGRNVSTHNYLSIFDIS